MTYNLRLDVSGDFENVCGDFHVPATLRLDSGDIHLDHVLNTPFTLKELEPAGGEVTRNGTLFAWSKSRSVRPRLGNVIIDNEDEFYWTIYRVDNKQHVETWEAFCLDLSIRDAAWNYVTVLKGGYTHGEAGEAKATWRGLWSDVVNGNADDLVLAHIQPSFEDGKIEFGAEYSMETYRAYFQEPIPKELAGGEFRLVASDGRRFRVNRYETEQRIDRLPVAICTKIVEGSEEVVGGGT